MPIVVLDSADMVNFLVSRVSKAIKPQLSAKDLFSNQHMLVLPNSFADSHNHVPVARHALSSDCSRGLSNAIGDQVVADQKLQWLTAYPALASVAHWRATSQLATTTLAKSI